LKIAYIIGSNSRNSGGLYNSVRNLAETVGENESYTTKIFGYNDERSKEDKYIYQKETLVDYNIIGSSKLAFTLDLKKKIKEFKPNVIHPQFLWLYPSYVSSKYSLKNKKST